MTTTQTTNVLIVKFENNNDEIMKIKTKAEAKTEIMK